MPINKVVSSFEEAIADVHDGATILIGGFGTSGGCPSYLIKALAKKGTKNLTIVGNTTGFGRELIRQLASLMHPPDWYDDVGLLVENGQVRKGIAAFPVAPSPLIVTPFEKRLNSGEVEIEMVPQGTLAARIQAAKDGIAAFYTPTGPGTVIAKGKEIRVFDGRKYVLEHAIKADFAFVRALKADRWGNLTYRGTSRTFNAVMAGAAKITIAEVDEIVPLGGINPELVVTPGIHVDRVVQRPEEGRTREVQKW